VVFLYPPGGEVTCAAPWQPPFFQELGGNHFFAPAPQKVPTLFAAATRTFARGPTRVGAAQLDTLRGHSTKPMAARVNHLGSAPRRATVKAGLLRLRTFSTGDRRFFRTCRGGGPGSVTPEGGASTGSPRVLDGKRGTVATFTGGPAFKLDRPNPKTGAARAAGGKCFSLWPVCSTSRGGRCYQGPAPLQAPGPVAWGAGNLFLYLADTNPFMNPS